MSCCIFNPDIYIWFSLTSPTYLRQDLMCSSLTALNHFVSEIDLNSRSSTSRIQGSRHASSCSVYVRLGLELSTSCMLGEHPANHVTSLAPRLHFNSLNLLVFLDFFFFMTDWHMILDTWNPSNGLPGWCTAYHPDGQDPISAANSGLTGHGRLNQFAHLLTNSCF